MLPKCYLTKLLKRSTCRFSVSFSKTGGNENYSKKQNPIDFKFSIGLQFILLSDYFWRLFSTSTTSFNLNPLACSKIK